MQTMFCIAFSKTPEVYYTGTMNGCIYVWKGVQLEEIIPDVHEGAIYAITTCTDGFLTAGRDGKIKFWNDSFGHVGTINLKEQLNMSEGKQVIKIFHFNDLKFNSLFLELIIRSLCWNAERVLIGSQSSEIIEIQMVDQDNPIKICQGHAEGELWALSVSANNPDLFATASDDKTVR